jgi:hypothetical protein
VSTGSRRVHFGCNTIRFSSNHPGILKELGTHFRHCSSEDGPIVANYEIAGTTEAGFTGSVNGSELFFKVDFETALWHLMQDSLTQLNGASTTQLVFHAAAMAHTQSGIVLCGQSGSGKSSLAAWLTANGLQYLTDEVIALPADGETISGVCRSIILKRGSAFIWQQWLGEAKPDGFLQFKDGSAWIDPTLFNSKAVQSKVAVAPQMLVFPHYVPNAQFYVERLTPAETLFRLLQCLVNARNFPDYGMTATARLARRVTAFSLIYSDIESATQWIKQTVLMG